MLVWYMAPPFPSGFGRNPALIAWPSPSGNRCVVSSLGASGSSRIAPSKILPCGLSSRHGKPYEQSQTSFERGTAGDRPQGRSGTVGEGEAEEGTEKGVNCYRGRKR